MKGTKAILAGMIYTPTADLAVLDQNHYVAQTYVRGRAVL